MPGSERPESRQNWLFIETIWGGSMAYINKGKQIVQSLETRKSTELQLQTQLRYKTQWKNNPGMSLLMPDLWAHLLFFIQ